MRGKGIFEVDGLKYAYRVQGSGPAVVMLHGFTGSAASWEAVGREMVGDFRILTVDLLGHGESSAPVEAEWYTMEKATQHLRALIDNVVGEAVHLLGYSMGGRLALYVTLEHPEIVQSLVLESASPGLESEAERILRLEADERLAERIETVGVDAFVKYWEDLPLFASQKSLPDPVRQQIHVQRLANRAEGLAGSLRGLGTGAQPNLWGRLSVLDKPVLLVAGELDEKFVGINRRMQGLLQSARLEVVQEAGHTVHLEQREVYVDLVKGFWEVCNQD